MPYSEVQICIVEQGLHRLEKYLNLERFLEMSLKIKSALTGWPRTLENRENGQKNSLQGKIREFEKMMKIREKSGNLKKNDIS